VVVYDFFFRSEQLDLVWMQPWVGWVLESFQSGVPFMPYVQQFPVDVSNLVDELRLLYAIIRMARINVSFIESSPDSSVALSAWWSARGIVDVHELANVRRQDQRGRLALELSGSPQKLFDQHKRAIARCEQESQQMKQQMETSTRNNNTGAAAAAAAVAVAVAVAAAAAVGL